MFEGRTVGHVSPNRRSDGLTDANAGPKSVLCALRGPRRRSEGAKDAREDPYSAPRGSRSGPRGPQALKGQSPHQMDHSGVLVSGPHNKPSLSARFSLTQGGPFVRTLPWGGGGRQRLNVTGRGETTSKKWLGQSEMAHSREGHRQPNLPPNPWFSSDFGHRFLKRAKKSK